MDKAEKIKLYFTLIIRGNVPQKIEDKTDRVLSLLSKPKAA